MSAGSLPSSLNFSSKLNASPASNKIIRIATNAGSATYSAGTTFDIQIPLGSSGRFWDVAQSYLNMTIKNASTTVAPVATPATLQGSAYCVFKSIRVECNGVLLDYIQDVNLLMYHWLAWNSGYTAAATHLNGCIGRVGSTYGTVAGLQLGATASASFSLPLIGLIASFKQYIPLGDATGTLKLSFQLDSASNCLYTGVANTDIPDYSVSNVVLVASMIDLDPMVADTVRSLCGGVYQLSGSSFESISYTNANNTTHNNIIGIQKQSVKSVYVVQRDLLAASVAPNADKFLSKIMNMSAYWFLVDGVPVPSGQVTCSTISEGYSEALRAFHSLGDLSTVNCVTYATFPTNYFMAACELEPFVFNRSQFMQAGHNTMSNPMYFYAQYSAAPGNNTLLCQFVHHDANLVLQGGQFNKIA